MNLATVTVFETRLWCDDVIVAQTDQLVNYDLKLLLYERFTIR